MLILLLCKLLHVVYNKIQEYSPCTWSVLRSWGSKASQSILMGSTRRHFRNHAAPHLTRQIRKWRHGLVQTHTWLLTVSVGQGSVFPHSCSINLSNLVMVGCLIVVSFYLITICFAIIPLYPEFLWNKWEQLMLLVTCSHRNLFLSVEQALVEIKKAKKKSWDIETQF